MWLYFHLNKTQVLMLKTKKKILPWLYLKSSRTAMADNEAKWMRILEVQFSSEDSEDLQLGLTLTHCSVMLTHTQLSLLRLERKASPASQPASFN